MSTEDTIERYQLTLTLLGHRLVLVLLPSVAIPLQRALLLRCCDEQVPEHMSFRVTSTETWTKAEARSSIALESTHHLDV